MADKDSPRAVPDYGEVKKGGLRDLTRGCLHRRSNLLPLRLLYWKPSCWPHSADMLPPVSGASASRSTSQLTDSVLALLTLWPNASVDMSGTDLDRRLRSAVTHLARENFALHSFDCVGISLQS